MPVRIALVIHSLAGAGGAERVLSTLAGRWAGRGWDVGLLTLDDGSRPPFYPLDPRVEHRPLAVAATSRSLPAALAANVGRVRALRRALVAWDPHVVISFMVTSNVLALVAARGLGLPVIASERVDPSLHRIGRAWALARERTYPWAASVVVQTERARAALSARTRARARVIPNPVEAPLPAGRLEPTAGPVLVALGRLTQQKGFDLLLEAFAAVAPRWPDWSVTIWGEGPERARLEARRAALGLDGRVRLPGVTASAHDELRRAELFVLSSRFEGFPNALCEAMACGRAAIAFDCPSGPAECIRPGIDGVLVPAGDVAALAREIERLIADPEARRRLGERARAIVDRFGIDRVLGLWDEALAAAGVQARD